MPYWCIIQLFYISLHQKVRKSEENIHKIELYGVKYEDRKRYYQSV